MMQNGVIKPGARLPTEDNLIAEYNVSRITARKAMEVLTQQGLVRKKPRVGAVYIGEPQPILENRNKTVAVVLSNSSVEMLKLTEAIERHLSASGFNIYLAMSGKLAQNELDACKASIERGACGLIVYPITETDNRDYFAGLYERDFPMVFLDRSPLVSCDIVTSDNYRGMYDLTQYAVSCGHTRIAFISYYDYQVLQERQKGWMDALKKNGIPPREEYNCRIENVWALRDNASLYSAVERLTALPEPPTAILCANDYMAITAMLKLKSMEYDVPGDISVCGYDNISFASGPVYRLTTVDQNYSRQGEAAAETVLRKLADPSLGAFIRRVRPSLVLRRSLAAPRGADN
jgi:DNA-binding LacI/PurR family transcriptional regulator